MTIRLAAVFFFIYQAIKHSRLQGDHQDILTILTFFFLAIAELSMIANRFLNLIIDAKRDFGNT